MTKLTMQILAAGAISVGSLGLAACQPSATSQKEAPEAKSIAAKTGPEFLTMKSCAKAVEDLEGQKRVTTKIKEIVRAPDFLDADHLAPDGGQSFFIRAEP